MKQQSPKLLLEQLTQWTAKQEVLLSSSNNYTRFFGNDDGGLSYATYKQIVAVKLLNNVINNKPHDPHGYKKEEVKIKYNSIRAIAEKFPNGTAAMMTLLAANSPPQDWAYYCGLTSDE